MKKTSLLLLLLLYLGVCGEKVALWDDAKDKPLKIFDYNVTSFPQADQDALRRGIPITSLPEYAHLLEDYFS